MHPKMILTIFRKDARDAIRDSRVLAAILIPIGIGLFYGYAFGDDDFEAPPVEVAYVVEDSTQLLEILQNVTSEAVDLELTQAASAAALREQLLDEEVDLGLIIPAGFDEGVQAGESPSLEILLHEEAAPGANYIAAAVQQSLELLAGRAPPATVQLDVVSLAEANQSVAIFEEIGPRQYFVLAAIMMLVAMNSILVVSVILAEEAEKKTLDALVMIASYTDVVVAKALVGLFYVTVSVVVMLGLTGLMPGNLLLFIAGIGLFSIAMVGIGLLLGGIFSNANQLNTWAGVFLIPVIAPAFMVGIPLPDTIETVLLFLAPSQSMRMAVNGMTGSAVFPDVWLSVLVLIAWAVVTYGLLGLRLSRRQA
ncbi:MAG: ABC transporter permease [Chloroflexia bacterium]|nr:ABC transporter permease [Chloroflexia bacterium]